MGAFILWAGKSSRIPGMSLPLMLPAFSLLAPLPPIKIQSLFLMVNVVIAMRVKSDVDMATLAEDENLESAG